jgi:hypothetical protein
VQCGTQQAQGGRGEGEASNRDRNVTKGATQVADFRTLCVLLLPLPALSMTALAAVAVLDTSCGLAQTAGRSSMVAAVRACHDKLVVGNVGLSRHAEGEGEGVCVLQVMWLWVGCCQTWQTQQQLSKSRECRWFSVRSFGAGVQCSTHPPPPFPRACQERRRWEACSSIKNTGNDPPYFSLDLFLHPSSLPLLNLCVIVQALVLHVAPQRSWRHSPTMHASLTAGPCRVCVQLSGWRSRRGAALGGLQRSSSSMCNDPNPPAPSLFIHTYLSPTLYWCVSAQALAVFLARQRVCRH